VLTLETDRLLFTPTPVSVLRERLFRADFVAAVPLDHAVDAGASQHLAVRFPEEWPGEDALAVLPIWLARRERAPDPGPWCDGVMIRREDRLAVGSMGFKSPPDPTGTVEIGYSVNRSQRGLGYATEMAGALVAWGLAQPEVRRVVAECLATNRASARVLEKVRFSQVGWRSSEDGDLMLWERRPTDVGPGRPAEAEGASPSPGGTRPTPG